MKPETNSLPSISQASEWARQAVRERKWPEAAQRWAVLRKAYPEHEIVWLQGAKAHIEADELDQAELLLKHGLQHFPNNPNTLIFSAELAIKQLHWDEAETVLQQAREIFPDFLQPWIISAECSEQQGFIEKANEYNQKARHCAPDNITPFVQYAEMAMRAEQWNTALERWKLVRSNFSDAPVGYRRAAEAARNINDHQLARKLLLNLEYGEHANDDEYTIKKTPSRIIGYTHPLHLLELIWTKANFNIRSEGQRNYLSYAWLILEPMLHILVYYIVFSLFLHRGGENFLVFLLAGQVPWMWFSKAVSGSSGSILAGQNLMLRVGLPSIIFPLINLLKVALQQIPVFLLLLGFTWLQGFPPSNLWIWLFPVIIAQLIFITAVACAVAAIIPFARDLKYLVETGLKFLMFGSGIFYDYKTLPAEWQNVFLLNPLAFFIKSYREILMDGVLPDLIRLGYLGLGSTVACLLLAYVYSKLRYIYPRIVME